MAQIPMLYDTRVRSEYIILEDNQCRYDKKYISKESISTKKANESYPLLRDEDIDNLLDYLYVFDRRIFLIASLIINYNVPVRFFENRAFSELLKDGECVINIKDTLYKLNTMESEAINSFKPESKIFVKKNKYSFLSDIMRFTYYYLNDNTSQKNVLGPDLLKRTGELRWLRKYHKYVGKWRTTAEISKYLGILPNEYYFMLHCPTYKIKNLNKGIFYLN